MKTALFAKEDKTDVTKVVGYLRRQFTDVSVFLGSRGDRFPQEALGDEYDIVISYLSPWIIPAEVLDRTKKWNINFHPAPPEYPGIGCFNFALYNNETEYGVTAHIMDEAVDTGKIIAVRRFPLSKDDSVSSLCTKSYEEMLEVFYEVVDHILASNAVSECAEDWSRAAYKRRELEELCRVTTDMSRDEIEKRIRATFYPSMPGPYVEICGFRFEYNPER